MEKSATEIYKDLLLGKIKRFPNKFLESEVGFNYSNAKEVTIYMIENVLGWNEDEVKKKLSIKVFKENKLLGMLRRVFNGSVYEALNNAYPGKYHEWELVSVPKGYWNLETAKKATKWLIEEKLKWSEDEVKENLCLEVFISNGLYGMIHNVFNGSIYEALNNAYPDKYLKWELSSTPRGYWNLETAKEATKWLIEEKLKLSEDEAKEKLIKKHFIENGLNGMLQKVFNGNVKKALRNVYGG